MLALPTKGISRSVKVHNVELGVFCDWIESSVLFDDKELSIYDIVDALTEGNIYEDADMAMQRVGDAWAEMRRRHSWIPHTTPFQMTSRRISRVGTWTGHCAYSFCLLLSLAQYYSGWASRFGSDYTQQGELFEELTKESLLHQFKDWQVVRMGWSPSTPGKLSDIVKKVAGMLGESVGNIARWTSDRANDGQLDLLCYRPFADKRVGVPVVLMQCASGADWQGKLHAPSAEIWHKVIDWAAKPKKGFSTPLAFEDGAFIRHCGRVDGLLLDRYRILAASTYKKDWVSPQLRQNVVAWLRPRVKALPRRD
jgi:hypothetical protein